MGCHLVSGIDSPFKKDFDLCRLKVIQYRLHCSLCYIMLFFITAVCLVFIFAALTNPTVKLEPLEVIICLIDCA